MKLSQIKKKLEKSEVELRDRFCVKALYVFGSVARDEATKKSDIDILVDYASDDVSLFDILDLKFYLQSLFGAEVDIVVRDAIKSSMRAEIESQAIRVA